MDIREFNQQSFMAGYMARNEEVYRTIRFARAGRKNVVKALYDDGLRDFRTMTLRAEVAARETGERLTVKGIVRKIIGAL